MGDSKRRRRLVVCLECHRQRCKCDKKRPCSRCQRLGINCQYQSDVELVEPVQSVEAVEPIDPSSLPQIVADLQSYIDELKAKLAVQTPPRSVLDVDSPSMKRSLLVCKPSRTLYFGPTSMKSILLSESLLKFLSIWKKNLSDEKRVWKELHMSPSNRLSIGESHVEVAEAAARIDRIISPNFFAFQERLIYFQKNLNRLLYGDFMPMSVIHSMMLSYFRRNDNEGEHPSMPGVHFIAPAKPYLYSDIALILSLVYTVHIFTRYNSDGHNFIYSLNVGAEDLLSLSFDLLNLSDVRRKSTQMSLLSLIVLRDCLYENDNSQGVYKDTDSYPMFQICVNICYQMGLHVAPESISRTTYKDEPLMKSRAMSADERETLWDFMQAWDCLLSASNGTPLLISYDFCAPPTGGFHSSFYNKMESCIMLLRKICLTINSRGPLSIRQVLGLIDECISFCNEIPFEGTFGKESTSNIDIEYLATLFKVKMVLLQKPQCLCRMVMIALNELGTGGGSELEASDVELITSLYRKMYRQSLLSAATCLYHIKAVCEGLTVFGEEPDNKYIVCFRDVISGSIAQSFIVWLSFLLLRATKNPELITGSELLDGYPRTGIYQGRIDINMVEQAYYSGEDNEDLISTLVTSFQFISFSSSFYDVMCRHQVVKEGLDSFVTLKSIIMWVYVLQALEEVQVMNKEVDMKEVIRKAKEKVKERRTDVGKLEDSIILEEEIDWEQLINDLLGSEQYE
ncbi:DEKNAAC103172 [Brettanomyces naardenensis]|uniref:DEKNAAC103172 n=1 Tax=Brettanomyces naardenensis TaxID=13370 RepID=A0A448YMK2_BRENA|nr:DEKNAAC103172 [Brettanomyces naardenensis]